MAVIPGAQGLGEVVARPQRFNETQTSPRAFGASIGQAMTDIGAAKISQQAEVDAAAARQQDAADRARAAFMIDSGKVKMRELADALAEDVRTGRVAREEALTEWQARAAEASDTLTRDAPQSYGLAISRELQVQGATLAGTVRGAVADRNRASTRADLFGLIEVAGRDALQDRSLAVNKVAQALATLGPAAGLAEDDQVRTLQQFRETAAYNVGAAMVRSARDDFKALDGVVQRLASDDFADLTPERRGALEQQVLARRAVLENRAAEAARRAEAAAARRLSEAAAATDSLQRLIDNGALPDQATVGLAAAKVAGTPYAAALTQMLRSAGETATFAQLTPREQEAELIRLRSRATAQGSNEATEKRLDRLQRIKTEGETLIKDDALAWGVQRRLVTAEPLQFGTLDELVQQLPARLDAARTVSSRLRQPVSPLFAGEARAAAQLVNSLPLPQKRAFLARVAGAVEPDVGRALARQLSNGDETLGLAMFAAINLPGSTKGDVADLILRGDDAIKAGRLKPASSDVTTARQYQQIAATLGEVTWATPQARDAAVTASQKVFDGLRDKGSGASARQAIELAVGPMTEWAGARVPLPPGMDDRTFKRRLSTASPQRLAAQAGGEQVMVAGQPMPVATLARNLGAVTLIPVGPGQYAVESAGAMVMRADGRALRLDVRALED